MTTSKKYTAFVHAGGTCSWYCAEGKTEAATKAVQQFKRDFKHIFKIKKGIEYKVSVFDTTGIENWCLDDYGYLHELGDGPDKKVIKDFETVKVYA
jgi:hypothetical protein